LRNGRSNSSSRAISIGVTSQMIVPPSALGNPPKGGMRLERPLRHYLQGPVNAGLRLLVDSQFRRANVSSARNQPVDVPTFPEMLAPARPQVLSVAPPLHPLLEDCPRSVGFGRRASTQSRTGHSEANNAEVAPPPSTAFPIRSHMSFIVTFFSCM
jgi:hypothetical protein